MTLHSDQGLGRGSGDGCPGRDRVGKGGWGRGSLRWARPGIQGVLSLHWPGWTLAPEGEGQAEQVLGALGVWQVCSPGSPGPSPRWHCRQLWVTQLGTSGEPSFLLRLTKPGAWGFLFLEEVLRPQADGQESGFHRAPSLTAREQTLKAAAPGVREVPSFPWLLVNSRLEHGFQNQMHRPGFDT